MHRTQRTRLVTGTTALAGVLMLAGCSTTSPSVITTPYPASDGVMADLGNTGVKLRNFLVVGTAKGAPASVIGGVINDSDSPVQISLQADLGASAQPSQTVVKVPAHGAIQIGPQQATTMTIPDLPVIPGATTGLSAATLNGGRADLSVPVLAATNEYAGLAPAPTTAVPTPTGKSGPTPSESSSDGATPTDTATDVESPSPTSTDS